MDEIDIKSCPVARRGFLLRGAQATVTATTLRPATQIPVFIVCAILLCCSGCQQPAGGSGTNRGALFDFTKSKPLFGGNSLFNNRSELAKNDPNRDAYEARIPDLKINDGAEFADSGGRRLDNDNQLLNTEVATLNQKLQLANQYNSTLKDQLAGTTGQVQQIFAEQQTAAQQIASLQMQLDQANQSLQLARQQSPSGMLAGYQGGGQTQLTSSGGATLRANNSLLQKLSAIQIPGGAARMDGDVIRIEFPSDRMFIPGTYQLQPSQMPVLQNIVTTVRESFSRQIIGVEAHWDGSTLDSNTTDHQLTATQSLAVFEQLTRLGLPARQLFTMAMASNRPRHANQMSGGISPNRRIEMVIYPETYDGP